MENKFQEQMKAEETCQVCEFFEPETKSSKETCPCEEWCKLHDLKAFMKRRRVE